MSTISSARSIIRKIAKKEGKTVEEIRACMKQAISEGFISQNAETAKMWNEIPRKGDIPTPEEFICWASKRIIKDGQETANRRI